ncbi:MAG: aspartyl/asparaginyl beta-hydroxylase domain-containing protein [Rudaea sp.]
MSSHPPWAVRLPFVVELRPLLHELALIPSESWSSHFNRGYHNGGWSGVALRSSGIDERDLYLDTSRRDGLRDMPLLLRSPALKAAVDRFACPMHAARLLRLVEGGVIEEHCDPDLRFEDGEARLHVPLLTNPDVEFYIAARRVVMEPGECWFLDLALPHRVTNRGRTPRVHLVVDVGVNDWLRELMARGDHPLRVPARRDGATEFSGFREAVLADRALAEKLRACVDREALAARAVELGAAVGYRFSAADVHAAMHEGRRRWISQWIV